jgi:hypothetical protein
MSVMTIFRGPLQTIGRLPLASGMGLLLRCINTGVVGATKVDWADGHPA